MKIHPINLVKLKLEIDSSGKINAKIKFNREEIGENIEKKSKTAENNLGNLPDELHFKILNDLDGQELVKCMRVSKEFSNTIKECPPLNRKVQDIQFSYAILESLKNDRNKDVKIAVAKACGNIGDKAWTRAILQRLQNDRQPVVRMAVAEACGNIGDKAWTRAILQSLQNDPDWRVRRAVAEACGNIGDNDVTRDILQSLKEDKDDLVKICVVEALLKN